MRFLLKANWDIDAGNAAAREGSLGRTVESILAEQEPEAAYFIADKGTRTALIVLDLADAAQIPAVAEPWFLAFNARVEITPAMVPDDLARAGPSIEQAVERYG